MDSGFPRQDCDFFHFFQSLTVAAAISLTAVRIHLPERLFRVRGDSRGCLGAAQMDVRRLPGHGVKQFVLILLATHRLDFNGRGIWRQLADQPLAAQAHERIGAADGLIQSELVVNSGRCRGPRPETGGWYRGLCLQGNLAALPVGDTHIAEVS